MNIFEKFYLKWKINRDEKFLLSEGIRKAKEKGIELKIGEDYILVPKEKTGEIHIPYYEGGADTRDLIAFVADDYPGITRRYLDNRKKLTGWITCSSSKV